MSKTLVLGYYGMQNVGDDAFCHVINYAIPKYWSVGEVLFASPPLAGLPRERFGLSENLFKHNSVGNRVTLQLSKYTLLPEADLLLFGGGSVFRNMTAFSEKRVYLMWKNWKRINMGAIGVSIGPFVSKKAERRLIKTLNRLDYLSVRDYASVERGLNAGLTIEPVVAADLVGMLPAIGLTNQSPTPRPGHTRLGVSVFGNSLVDQDSLSRINSKLIEVISAFCTKNGMPVTIFIFNSHRKYGDVRATLELASKLKNIVDTRIITAKAGLKAICDSMMECNAFIHTRLHGGIFSYVFKKPFVLLPYHPKNNDFLDEIGQNASLRTPYDFSKDRMMKLLTCLFSDPPKPLLDPLDYEERAKLNFTAAPWADDNLANSK
jgi:polysaccharide pyruvyl transferase WcaK-like protein